ncbi:hypothetical protein [Moorena sp. SIO3H5]|nr:hypothetical protein [Moorena sp. SIO3H5]
MIAPAECGVKTLGIRNLLDCSQFLLWDAASDRLVSIKDIEDRSIEG